MKTVRISPSPTLKGVLQIPGDKSISHRAVMFSALAEGKSTLRGLLLGEDVLATLKCFQEMGVKVEIFPDHIQIHGVGLKGLKSPTRVLDCGNSGTTMRLMMGILAAQPFTSRLTGDASLNRRPMERVLEPLREMGADIEELRASEAERVLKINGRPLKGIDYTPVVASAQVKSALLLAGLYASGTTRIRETVPSRNHTEILLLQKGVNLKKNQGGLELISPGRIPPGDLEIPRDISSAAFFLVAGLIGKNSELLLPRIGINPTRTGILDVLKAMGGDVQISSVQKMGGEEVADLRVRGSSLRGTRISGTLIPRLIDEIPVICVAGACAQGITEIRNAEELRVKESDRIKSAVLEFRKMSIKINELEDGLILKGSSKFQGGELDSHSDHRMAMSLAVAATQALTPSLIRDVDCVKTSYPQFFDQLAAIGGKVEWV